MSIIIGVSNLIRGIPDKPKLLIDAIPAAARVRYRFRQNDWARAFVKSETGTREFLIIDRTPEYWGLDYERGSNQTL